MGGGATRHAAGILAILAMPIAVQAQEVPVPQADVGAPPPPDAAVPDAVPAPSPEGRAEPGAAEPAEIPSPDIAAGDQPSAMAEQPADASSDDHADVSPAPTAGEGSVGEIVHHHAALASYNQIRVTGADGVAFHYIRQDFFADYGTTDAARVRAIVASGNYGPLPVGSIVSVRAGSAYILLPVCDDHIVWRQRRIILSAYGEPLKEAAITCR